MEKMWARIPAICIFWQFIRPGATLLTILQAQSLLSSRWIPPLFPTGQSQSRRALIDRDILWTLRVQPRRKAKPPIGRDTQIPTDPVRATNKRLSRITKFDDIRGSQSWTMLLAVRSTKSLSLKVVSHSCVHLSFHWASLTLFGHPVHGL